MRCLLKLVALPALSAWTLLATNALAVDPAGIKINDRWSVVGVIAGDETAQAEAGIAVIRNNTTKRTYTLAIGDSVPTEFGFTLKSVRNRNVIIGNETQHVTLAFSEPSTDETEPVSQTTRFIDNYYRSLDAPAEGVRDEEPIAINPNNDLNYEPLTRFGSRSDDGRRARFELYRAERGYRERQDDADVETDEENFETSGEDGTAEYRGDYSSPSVVDEVTQGEELPGFGTESIDE